MAEGGEGVAASEVVTGQAVQVQRVAGPVARVVEPVGARCRRSAVLSAVRVGQAARVDPQVDAGLPIRVALGVLSAREGRGVRAGIDRRGRKCCFHRADGGLGGFITGHPVKL